MEELCWAQITVYFADYISTGAGQNMFDIVINGNTLETGVDVHALGGGSNQAVSFGLPVYSGSRSNFDISFPTTAGFSIAAGIEFGWATNTSLTALPSTTTWGDGILLESTVSSLNPNLMNVTTGSVQWTLNGIVVATGTVTGNPDGTATAWGCGDTTLVDCAGGTWDLTATYLGGTGVEKILMYSSSTAPYTLTGTCATTTPETTTTTPATTTIIPSTSAPPSTTPETTTTSPPTTTIEPSTTPVTTTATPSTTPEWTTSNPPTTTEAPVTTPATTTVNMTMDMVPNPPVPAAPLTVFGEAVASSGPAPTGNVTVFVDGVPVATAPLVPAPDGGGGRRLLLQQSSTSVFSVTIIAPSTPGIHTIIVSNSDLQFPYCKAPLRVVASVAGTNNTVPVSGSITLSIIGASSPHIGAAPLNIILASANITAGVATFDLITNPITAAAETLTGATPGAKLADVTAGAKLLPGSYHFAAAYSGDGNHLPGQGNARLDIGITCPIVSLTALTLQP
ncbi:g6962 [Coccomyxa elongata]